MRRNCFYSLINIAIFLICIYLILYALDLFSIYEKKSWHEISDLEDSYAFSAIQKPLTEFAIFLPLGVLMGLNMNVFGLRKRFRLSGSWLFVGMLFMILQFAWYWIHQTVYQIIPVTASSPFSLMCFMHVDSEIGTYLNGLFSGFCLAKGLFKPTNE